jgi:hypothetical protein
MVELIQDCLNDGLEIFHTIAHGFNDEHGDRQSRQVLLKLQIAVHREKYIELSGGEFQELPVLDPSPSTALHG